MTRCESIWCIWSYLNKTKRPHEWFLLQPKLFVLFWIPVVPPKRKSFTYIFIKKPRLHFLADGFVPLVVSWDAYSFSVHSVVSWAPDCSVALGFGFAHCVWWSQINRGSINHEWKPTSTFYLFLQKKINAKFNEFCLNSILQYDDLAWSSLEQYAQRGFSYHSMIFYPQMND